MSASEDDRRFWIEFIDIYRENPCLWKVKSKEYSDRNKKNAAYDLLVEKMREKDKEASREFVTKKINNFRSAFRKEYKKVLASMKSGTVSVDYFHVYKQLHHY